jgi:hypothetical protein
MQLCFCMVQLRPCFACVSLLKMNLPITLTNQNLSRQWNSPSFLCTESTVALLLYGRRCDLQHVIFGRQKRTGRLRQARKLYLSCLLKGGLGTAFVLLQVTSARWSVHCCCTCWAAGVSTASVLNLKNSQLLLLYAFFWIIPRRLNFIYFYFICTYIVLFLFVLFCC